MLSIVTDKLGLTTTSLILAKVASKSKFMGLNSDRYSKLEIG
jgi:hypothetical protein